jgi:hypothetical protein
MLSMQDIESIEGGNVSESELYESLQRAINGLTAWHLQGHYGRMMMDAISDGYCLLGTRHTRDYWGNRIPSRDEVQRGTKGSFEYVAAINGQEYAERMASL